MSVDTKLIARSPLVELHRRGGAAVEVVDGWLVAMRYLKEPGPGENGLVDLSHWATYEINGRQTGPAIERLIGSDVPVRRIHQSAGQYVYRLSPERAIIFAGPKLDGDAIDVTGGWASLTLAGPDAEQILSKVTAVDLRQRTLGVGACCQGPIFGVNTLFGRLAGRFDLHVCTDSVEFFWEVLMDAGSEFGLRPAGTEWMSKLG